MSESIKVTFISDPGLNRPKNLPTRTGSKVTVQVGGLQVEAVESAGDEDPSLLSDATTLGNSGVPDAVSGSGGSRGSRGPPQPSNKLLLYLLFSGTGFGFFFVLLAATFLFAVPVTTIVIGRVFIGDCYEDSIAILLIVGGTLSVLSIITRASVNGSNSNFEDLSGPYKALNLVHNILIVADCIWFIVASVFVYKIYTTVELDNKESATYCHRTLYLYAFWYLTICWVIFALALLRVLIKICYNRCLCLWKTDEEDL